MDRQEAITQVAQIAAFAHDGYTIGVLLPSFEDGKLFQSELVAKLDELPEWFGVSLTVRTFRHVETNRGMSIRFLHNVHHARGLTFNSFYLSSRLTEEQKSQYVFSLLPAMVNNQPITTFDDK